MSVAALLSQLRARDIRVWVDGEQLRLNAPAGALTDELRGELARRKRDIVGFLSLCAIVPLQAAGPGVPVFGVPPHTGDVFAYRALARALGAERPFFALQPPGLDGRRAPLERVEALAAYFAQQVRAQRPHGPCIVAGICMGGTVAFELAQQLVAAGGEVPLLAFFGVPHPAFFRPLSILRHDLGNRARGVARRMQALAAQSNRERLQYLAWRARLHRQPRDPVLALRSGVEQATLRAVQAYEPRAYAGRVHHFMPCAGWSRRDRAQAERWHAVARVEDHHGPDGCAADDMMLDPHAPRFAAQFRRVCAKAGL